MLAYLVSVTEHSLESRSFVAGIYASKGLADAAATRIYMQIADDATVTVNVTETKVIGYAEPKVKSDSDNS